MKNPIGSMKDMYKLKRRADDMKRQMEAITIEVEDGGVKVIMQGDNKIQEIWIDGELNTRVKGVLNQAVKDVQKKVAKKMRGQLSDFGIPGL